MSRVRRTRRVPVFVAVTVALVAAVWLARRALPSPRPVNLVLVVIDTLRRDHLATYGYHRDAAPFLDRLARSGAALQGRSPSSWTKPATASILTGLHPLRHQAQDRRDALSPRAATLGEILGRHGFQTLAGSANGWVSHSFGFDRGFADFVSVIQEGSRAADLNAAVLPRLLALREPFFVYVHYVDPHLPYDPPADWRGRPLPPGSPGVTLNEVYATRFASRPEPLLRRANDLYDGEIRAADDAVRALAAQLERRGVLSRTLLVVTSDHGEELQDHGRMGHGQTLYEEVLRVPLVFHGPGIAAGSRLGRASLLDVAPTVLDLLGVDAGGASFDGKSLATDLRDGRRRNRPPPELAQLDLADGVGLALIDDRHKLVLAQRPYYKQLFDTAADPSEQHDLAAPADGAAADVIARLGAETVQLYDRYNRDALPRRIAAVDDERARALAALGYAAVDAPPQARRIPHRIAAADDRPDGLLGWEPSAWPSPCLRLGDARAAPWVLDGWYDAEPTGRWTGRRGLGASLALPAGSPNANPDVTARLEVRGENYTPHTIHVQLATADRMVADAILLPGPYVLAAELHGLPAAPSVLRIALDRTHQMPSDDRLLGIFVNEVCLRVSRPAGGRPPGLGRGE